MNTSSTPRVGLAGLGGYAQQHLIRLLTLHEAGLCRLVAAADPFFERHGATVAALKAQDVAILPALETMLEREEIDAVFLATPIHLHERQTVAALEAGKHVYLEKPPCPTLREWARMTAAQRRSGRVCAVGFQMQSHAALHFLQRELAEGAIGRLRHLWSAVRWSRTDAYYARSPWAGRWSVEGQPVFDGPATNALSHVVQAALSLTASAPGTMPQLAKVRGGLWRARPIESYDSAFLEAQTPDEVTIRLAFTHATSIHDGVVLRCEGETGTALLTWAGNVTIQRDGEEGQEYAFPCEPGMGAMLDFLKATTQPDHAPAVPIEATLPYLQTVNGALQYSRGAAAFEPERVSYVAGSGNDGAYHVTGLDEEFAAFAHDFDDVPPSLAPRNDDWLTPQELTPDLSLD